MTLVRTITGLAALGAAFSIAAVAQAQDSVGVTAAIRNSVRTQAAGENTLRPAALRAPVRLGDLIVSGAQSQMQVLLRDRSIFTVGANARLTIDRFVFDAERGAGGTSASVTRGAFRFVSGRGAAGTSSVRTPVASIGVRGTVVEIVVGEEALAVLQGESGMPAFTGSPETASLIVLRGPGPLGSGFDTPGAIDVTSGGATVSVEQPGQAFLASSGEMFGPFALSDEASERLSALLRPSPTSNTDSGPSDVTSASVDSGLAAFFGEGGEAVSATEEIEPTLCGDSGGQQSPTVPSQSSSSCGRSVS